jgi:hypothetical protein
MADQPPDDRSGHRSIKVSPEAAAAFAKQIAAFNRKFEAQLEPVISGMQKMILDPYFEKIGHFIAGLPSIFELLPKLPDFTRIFRDFPTNLVDREGIDHERLGDIARTDGIPISWVPSSSVIDDLLAAPDSAGRLATLLTQQVEILHDCVALMTNRKDRCSAEVVRAANAALNGDYHLAQSHASNIIDSIVLRIFPTEQRKQAVKRAKAPLDQEVPFLEYAQHLTLIPLAAAYTTWYPAQPLPERFNRHATAHAVGHQDVFTELFCLIAVMLATSLTRQFEPQDEPEVDRSDL